MSSYTFSHIKKNNKSLTRSGQIIKSRPDLAAAQHRSFAYDKYQAEAWKKYFLDNEILSPYNQQSSVVSINLYDILKLAEPIQNRSLTAPQLMNVFHLGIDPIIQAIPNYRNSFLLVTFPEIILVQDRNDQLKCVPILVYNKGEYESYYIDFRFYIDNSGETQVDKPLNTYFTVGYSAGHEFAININGYTF
ncbi:ORF3 [Donkey kirkovirus Hetian-58]|nr:ORF3 [Donkey kirkovirus Hetian-46]UJP31659.1 ORF3 [Donkey kirkovirus Hetian-48]UJP31665.1 ORF3 [Donkey kirkovirus Hetian-58]UJP31760.1 ORF3 [Porcine kirkovirus Cj-D5]UJP31766.1 ORF3 [Porcine kirkovirus Cj-D32]UJP31772.1 ORF3 [Porcine kirkovirus Cj-D43]